MEYRQNNKSRKKRRNKKEEEERAKESVEENETVSTEDIQKIVVQISGCSECDVDNINEWLQCDSPDPGYQILDNDEIIQSVNDEYLQVDEDDDNVASVEPGKELTASEACLLYTSRCV